MRVDMSTDSVSVNGKSCYTYLAYKTQRSTDAFNADASSKDNHWIGVNDPMDNSTTLPRDCYHVAAITPPLSSIFKPQKTILSLFSGGGGLDIAASREGFSIVESHEWDATACAAYERALGLPIQETDLARIDPYSLADTDIIIGGPPCQEFSHANVRGCIDGAKNLWPATLKIVKVKRPSIVIFENVTGLVYRAKNRDYFRFILDTLASYGYAVESRILNAANYGVPQTRERVFIVGRLDGRAWSWPTPTHTETGDMFAQRWVSWRDALPDIEKTSPLKTMPKWVTDRPTYQPLPQNALFNVRDQFKDILHRDASKPAFTVTSEGVMRSRFVIDGTVYGGTTRAMTRLQTLPDVDMPSHVIGNAVPPLLGQSLFRAMKGEA